MSENDAFDEFVTRWRATTYEQLRASGAMVSIVPGSGELDAQFCLELGAAIMLNKPIIAVAPAGVPVPPALARLSERVVSADIETEEGQRQMHEALDAVGEAVARREWVSDHLSEHMAGRPPDGFPDHVFIVVADYGPDGGGWGPVAIPGMGPAVYTGEQPHTVAMLRQLAANMRAHGMEAHFLRFTEYEVEPE